MSGRLPEPAGRRRTPRKGPGARARLVVAAVLLWAGLSGSGSFLAAEETAERESRAEQAVRLYDAGRYAEALAILEALDQEGRMTGPLLYRLSFCLRVVGEAEAERHALERAIEALERENTNPSTLEIPFYLVNAYLNAGRRSEARRTALRALQAVRDGTLAVREDPLDGFRLAKLYADAGRRDDAVTWFRRALDGLEPHAASYPAYVRWAAQYVGDVAFSRADYAGACRAYERGTRAAGATQALWDRLAVCRVKTRDYAGAAEAWHRAERINPADANRARYARHLAALAETLETLPEASPDGTPWNRLDRAGLEQVMAAMAAELRRVQREVAENRMERDTASAEIRKIQGWFVAAGLEYTARHLPIRETAFQGGYAPLIFKPRLWELPGE